MAIGKRSGKKSQGSNDFLMPKTPTIGTATNVGTGRAYNNGAATVTFTADPTYAADSFTVTSTPGSFTGTGASSPITVTGLQSDTAYTFKVTATNTYGTSGESAASNSITATTVPATPAAPTASSPNADADVVSWSAPANGGSAITNYHWQSNEDPVKEGDTATTASVTVVQEAGTLQRYKVYATNANGNSEYSALSNEITTTFSFVPFSVFGFSPFQVFGFSPFAVFGFSPFSVFGFSPFRVFGFSPFRVFGFSPICFDEHSFILTDAGYKKAKDITDEDTLVLSVFDEMPLANIDTIGLWKSKSLTNIKNINSKVTYTKMHEVENTTIFNEDIHNRVSNTEEVLILRDAEYLMMKTDSVALGDKLVKFVDNQEVHEVVNKVDSVKEKRKVYEFGREVFGLINASGVLVYHLYPID
jgi:hypothetical protein